MHEKLRIGYGDAAHGNHRSTCCKCLLNILLGFDSTTEINHEGSTRRNSLEYGIINDMLRLGTIKVNHMQSIEAQTLEVLGYFSRIIIIDLLLVVIAFRKTYALPVDQVDGRN